MKECPKCHELLGDNVDQCFNCNYNFKLKKVVDNTELKRLREEAEERKQESLKIKEEVEENKNEQIRKNALYEYKTIVINDLKDGTINEKSIQNALSDYSRDGWRLHSIFSNEVGKTTTSVTVNAFGSSINATIEQTVMIFERCIKAEEK